MLNMAIWFLLGLWFGSLFFKHIYGENWRFLLVLVTNTLGVISSHATWVANLFMVLLLIGVWYMTYDSNQWFFGKYLRSNNGKDA